MILGAVVMITRVVIQITCFHPSNTPAQFIPITKGVIIGVGIQNQLTLLSR